MSENEMGDALPDRWTTRDLPVLREASRLLDGARRSIGAQDVALGTDLESDEVKVALATLVKAGYLEGKELRSFGGTIDVMVSDVTERGMRTVGIWPSGEGVDALVDALRQAEEATDDPEEKTLIRRATGAVGSVSRGVMTDVLAAVVRQQMGV